MNKLVRGKIIDILQADNVNVSWRKLENNDEFKQALFNKLKEEVREFLENPSLEELADISEVLDALIPLYGSIDEFQTIFNDKRNAKGDFSSRVFIDEIEY